MRPWNAHCSKAWQGGESYPGCPAAVVISVVAVVEWMPMPIVRCFFLPVLALAFLLGPKATVQAQTKTAIYSGIAQFPDVQTPTEVLSEDEESMMLASPTSNHGGFAMGLGLDIPVTSWTVKPVIEIDLLHIATIEAERQTFGSTYNRLGLGSSMSYALGLGWLQTLNGGLELRRSIYRNVSSGHYVDSIIPKVTLLGNITTKTSWQTSLGYAALSRFGYNSGDATKSGAMPGTASTLMEISAQASYHLSKKAQVSAGYDLEQTNIAIGDVTQYARYGLTVPRNIPKAQNLQLATSVFKIGLHTNW